MIYAGPMFYPAEDSGEFLRRFREWAPNAPDEITAVVGPHDRAPLPVIPEELARK